MWRQRNEVRPETLHSPWDPHALLWRTQSSGPGRGAPISYNTGCYWKRDTIRSPQGSPVPDLPSDSARGPGCAEERRVWAGVVPKPAALIKEFIFVAALNMRGVLDAPPPAWATCNSWIQGAPYCSSGQARARSFSRDFHSQQSPGIPKLSPQNGNTSWGDPDLL